MVGHLSNSRVTLTLHQCLHEQGKWPTNQSIKVGREVRPYGFVSPRFSRQRNICSRSSPTLRYHETQTLCSMSKRFVRKNTTFFDLLGTRLLPSTFSILCLQLETCLNVESFSALFLTHLRSSVFRQMPFFPRELHFPPLGYMLSLCFWDMLNRDDPSLSKQNLMREENINLYATRLDYHGINVLLTFFSGYPGVVLGSMTICATEHTSSA